MTSSETKEQADLVVIGSGAGGMPMALTLAEAGASVVVLEKGPWYSLRDFTHDEVGICRRDFFVPYPYPGYDPHTIQKKGDARARPTTEGWIGRCVGGGNVHMSGFTYRLHDEDFRLATLTGGVSGAALADWPISLAELTPFYDLAEARIGVSGLAGTNPFEKNRRPYPLPPLDEHPAATLVDAAGLSLGWTPFPTARAVLSRPYGGRPPCNYCGFCGDYGCENQSKSSVLSTLVPQAEATGRCQIKAGCMATRIVVDGQDRVRAVEYTDSRGQFHEIRARAVCLSASALESARLLMLSQGGRFPHGLANRSGLLGKNLTFSTFGKATAVLDRAAVAAAVGHAGMELPFLQRSVQDDYWVPKKGFAVPKGGTYNFLLHHPNPINAAVRLAMDSKWTLWGQPLKDRLAKYFHDELWIEVEIFSEFLPWSGCFVDLDPQVKDAFGLPVASIHCQHHPAGDEINRYMTQRAVDVLKALQPAPLSVQPWTWESTTFHLQHGTCRFGDNPEKSVLNRWCESHDVRNLYVTDASFMPTSGGVPATPTILANAFRVGAHLAERFRKGEIP